MIRSVDPRPGRSQQVTGHSRSAPPGSAAPEGWLCAESGRWHCSAAPGPRCSAAGRPHPRSTAPLRDQRISNSACRRFRYQNPELLVRQPAKPLLQVLGRCAVLLNCRAPRLAGTATAGPPPSPRKQLRCLWPLSALDIQQGQQTALSTIPAASRTGSAVADPSIDRTDPLQPHAKPRSRSITASVIACGPSVSKPLPRPLVFGPGNNPFRGVLLRGHSRTPCKSNAVGRILPRLRRAIQGIETKTTHCRNRPIDEETPGRCRGRSGSFRDSGRPQSGNSSHNAKMIEDRIEDRHPYILRESALKTEGRTRSSGANDSRQRRTELRFWWCRERKKMEAGRERLGAEARRAESLDT